MKPFPSVVVRPGLAFLLGAALVLAPSPAARGADGDGTRWEVGDDPPPEAPAETETPAPPADARYGTLTVEIRERGRPAVARMRLLDADGQSRWWTDDFDGEAIEGSWSRPWPAGLWRLETGVAGIWTLTQPFRVVEGKETFLPVEAPLAPDDRPGHPDDGWIVFDPWVSPRPLPNRKIPLFRHPRNLDLARRAAGVDALALARDNVKLTAFFGADDDSGPDGRVTAVGASGESGGPAAYALLPPGARWPDHTFRPGSPAIEGGPDTWHNTLDVWRRAGAFTVLNRPNGFRGSGEVPFLIAGGPFVDAVDLGDGDRDSFRLWTAWLSRGHFPTPVAGGPTPGDERNGAAPAPGLWLQTGGRTDPAALLEALRAGRTVAGNGPFLSLAVDGAGPGDRLTAGPAPRALTVTAWSTPERPLSEVECWYNGRVIQRWRVPGNQLTARLESGFPEPGWLLLRGRGARRDDGVESWAVTAPVRLERPTAAGDSDGASAPSAELSPFGWMRMGVWLRSGGQPAAGWAATRLPDGTGQRFAIPPEGATLEFRAGARLHLGLDAPGTEPVERDPFRDAGLAAWLARAETANDPGWLLRPELHDALARRLATLRLIVEW